MKVKKEEDKKKTISFSVDPRVYEMWVKYCEENGIENYSSFIEKVIIEKTKRYKVKKRFLLGLTYRNN